MKTKLLLVLSLVLFSLSVSAQTYHLKAEHITISDGSKSETEALDVDIKWDVSTERITI